MPRKLIMMMPWGRVGSNLLISLLYGSFNSSAAKFVNEPLNRIQGVDEQANWFRDFYHDDAELRLIASKHAVRAICDLDQFGSLIGENGLWMIRQRRANLVKVAVSQLRGKHYAQKTEKEIGRAQWGVLKGKQPLPPIALDTEHFVEILGSIAKADRKLATFEPDCPTFDIEYETIKDDPKQTIAELIAWLDVEPQRDPEIRYVKATPDTLAEAVPNLTELREAASNAGFDEFDPMFDE